MKLIYHLEREIETWAQLRIPALLQRFVVRNGHAYEPMARIGPKQPDKDCFKNATEYVLADGGQYVEGYALRPSLGLCMHHAWVEIDGRAMDPTWKDPEDCLYFGIPFETETLEDELFVNRVYGLLDTGRGLNIDLMFRIDPELKEIVEKIANEALRLRQIKAGH
jgi:hypothetical protein